MDHTKQPPTVLSVCTGFAGIERGISQVIGEVSPLAYVEVEAVAAFNLVEKMEAGRMAPAPIWSDVKTFPVFAFCGVIDILAGGYPCQPFSNAGRRLGTADDQRHLWPYIRRIIRVTQPKLCFFENVEGHINRGLEEVLEDLEAEGYRTTWGIFSAAEVGAPHGRKRVFLMGDKGFDWKTYMAHADSSWEPQPDGIWGEVWSGAKLGSEVVAHAVQPGLEGHGRDEQATRRSGAGQDRSLATGSVPLRCDSVALRWPARPGERQHEWEEPRLVQKFNRKGV